MRLFIALDLDELRHYFKDIQQNIKGAKSKSTDSFHITLKFLGEIEESKIKGLISSLEQLKFPKFSINTGGIGAFPNPDYVRVVWIGASSEGDMIQKLHKDIDEKLYDLGFKKEAGFVPHITLTRIRSLEDKKLFSQSISMIRTEEKTVKCKNFYLMKSTLTKIGPVYEKIKVFELA